MPTLTIGDRKVTVGDEFLKLSPEQQNSTVDEIARAIPQTQKSLTDYIPEAVSDIPSEIGRTAGAALETMGKGLLPGEREQQSNLQQFLSTGKAIAAVPALAASPITGALKSLIGHPMASLEQKIGGLIAPEIAAKEKPEDVYRQAASGVETALSGLRPGRAPSSFMGVKTVAPVEAKIEEMAVNKILNRINQDVKAGSPNAKDMIDLANASGRPMTLADVGGENIRGLAGNIARMPGAGRNLVRQFLNRRDEQAALRLSQDIDKYVSGGPGMQQATEALLKARSDASRPLYEKTQSLQHVWSPRLDEFLKDPVVQHGLKRGFEIERMQALAEGRSITATQLGIDLDIEGNIKLVDKPNMRLLDMAKQGLDAMVADERNEFTGRLTARGVALDRLRQSYVKTMDDLDTSGVYKRARQTWGGYSQSLDALKAGRTLFQKSPAEIASEIKDLTPGNKEFYRLGVADVVRERLAKAGLSSDESKAMIRNAWTRDQLRPIFRTDADFQAFTDAVTNEAAMFQTRQKVLGGSQTAERLAEDQAAEHGLSSGGIDVAEKLARGSWFSAARTAYRMWKDLGLRPNEKLNEKIAEILFATPISGQSALGQQLIKGFVPPNRSNYLGNSAYFAPSTAALGATIQAGSNQ